jgi:hypothetical protein
MIEVDIIRNRIMMHLLTKYSFRASAILVRVEIDAFMVRSAVDNSRE